MSEQNTKIEGLKTEFNKQKYNPDTRDINLYQPLIEITLHYGGNFNFSYQIIYIASLYLYLGTLQS